METRPVRFIAIGNRINVQAAAIWADADIPAVPVEIFVT